ncbi:MAG: hypothetical protein ABIO83_11005 [Ilumatobacteraceae bacterium]
MSTPAVRAGRISLNVTANKPRRRTPDQIICKFAVGHEVLAGGQEFDEVRPLGGFRMIGLGP